MTDLVTNDLGTYIEYNGRPAVRFIRNYPHPVERVWAAISDPERLGQWFPSQVQIEPRVGGAISFAGDPYMANTRGVVLAYDPPRRLAFSWGEDEMHFAVDPVEDVNCRLTLINVLDDRSAASRNAAGWTVCLTELDKLLDGRPVAGPHSAEVEPFEPIYEAYKAAGMPWGAEIPAE
jgi:uncharacterized protein YndB with AHSA1/START domain